MNRLGIELQSVFGMPPVQHVVLAAELGCGNISTGLSPVPWNPYSFPRWSLRDDPDLRREVMAAMRDRDVSISLAEGFGVRPHKDVRDRARDLDLVAELGARQVSAVSMEADMARALDQLATLAQMAEKRGMGLTLEFSPPHPINSLASAQAAIRHIGKTHVRLVIDAMHFFRSGATVAELAALDPDLIGYVQLCDVPLVSRIGDYLQEACFQRMIPGEGELPLRDFLAALPKHLEIGLEVPMLPQPGEDLRSKIGRAVKAARELLVSAGPMD